MEKIVSERSIVPACTGRKGELLALWEQSVRATHTFLKEADIKALFPFVSEALEKVGRLLCICNMIVPLWMGRGIPFPFCT